eukprot:4438865-Amphidinium_carterae.2
MTKPRISECNFALSEQIVNFVREFDCRSKLLDYVSTATSLGRQEGIAVLKLMNEFGESSSTEQMHACMSIVSNLARLGFWEREADLKELMLQKIDGTLCEVNKESKNEHIHPPK